MDAMNTDRVACINTEGYTGSLVLNAIYETLPYDVAAKLKLVRVVDESGEDCLYPESYFVPAEVFEKAPDREFHTRA